MQIWQLLIVHRHPVVEVCVPSSFINRFFGEQMKCDNKLKQVFFISTLREHSVNRKDLRALTLVGPPRDNLELEPLAVLHLDNGLYIPNFDKSFFSQYNLESLN